MKITFVPIMNFKYVLEDILKFGGTCLGVGVLLGGLTGILKERRRNKEVDNLRISLPERIAHFPDMAACIIELGNAKRANMNALDKIIRRCDNLLKLFESLESADPETVRQTISGAATHMYDSISRYMQLYYIESDIPTYDASVPKAGDMDSNYKPVNSNLRSAHELLLQLIDAIAFRIRMEVKSKMEQKAALVVYREDIDF